MTLTDPTPPGLYDSQRKLYYAKPALRGWMHLLWFEASLVLGTIVLLHAHGLRQLVAIAIYVASVSGLFGASSLYHRGNWGPAWSARLQRLDHAMIFVLIAGTATPAFLLAAPPPYDVAGVVVVWGLTITALIIHLTWMDAPETLVGATVIGLGVVAGLAVPGVWIHAGIAPAVLMLAGGGLYAAGAISYHRRCPDPRPTVFGYHEVFHAYVCVAAACQYTAIACFLL